MHALSTCTLQLLWCVHCERGSITHSTLSQTVYELHQAHEVHYRYQHWATAAVAAAA
jgi:hypothetical protein